MAALGPLADSRRQEDLDGFFKAPLQQVIVPAKRNARLGRGRRVSMASGSGGSHTGKTARAPVRTRLSLSAAEPIEGGGFALQVGKRGSAAKGIQRAVPERGVGCGDDRGQLAHGARLSPGGRRLAHGQQLDQLGQDLVAIAPAQRQGQLRGQQPVPHADIVAPVGALERQVLLVPGQFGERGREADARAPGNPSRWA